jgi:hypothetical protein
VNRNAVAVTLALAVLAPRPAAADRETCARSYETAQRKRIEGKLVEARKDLVECAQDQCPAVLRKDCAVWLSEVESQMPTMAIRAIGVDGCDHPEAEIAVDGQAIAHGADGLAFTVDPGPHVIRATIGGVSMEEHTVVTANERRRAVTIMFGKSTTCTHQAAPSAPPPPAPRPTEQKSVPTSVFVLGGIGVVAAGVATVFSVSGWSQKSTLDECKGACAQDDVDAMRRTFVVADLTTVLAIGAFVTAGVLYLTR